VWWRAERGTALHIFHKIIIAIAFLLFVSSFNFFY
jgi:hypothetical protein